MLLDADEVARDAELRADVVVVGAGAAGITIARSLDAAGVDVLLLEAGTFEEQAQDQALYEGEVVGHPYTPLDRTRLRYLGGTTNHWHGWCRPFKPIDFERREGVPHSGWPIRFEDVDHWYDEAHRILDLGPREFSGAGWDEARGLTAPPDTDWVQHEVFQFSEPTKFRTKYGEDLIASPRIRLVTGANVTHVALHQDGSRVERLDVTSLAGNAFTVAGTAVVLAAGSLENVRLLLVSDDVHAAGIGNQHDVVGRFFLEHPHVRVPITARLSPAVAAWLDRTSVPGGRLDGGDLDVLGVLSLEDGRRRRQGRLGWTAELWPGPDEATDVEGLLHPLAGAAGLVRGDEVARRRMTLRTEQQPNPDSRVRLIDEVDQLGLRRVQLDWQFTEDDRHAVDSAVEAVGRHLGAMGAGTVRATPDNGASWLDGATPGNHQLGVTRMSADPVNGVVDSDCRVHGVGNLHLAGGCVFATGSEANPTLTVVALALRLADHLARQVRS